MGNRELLEKSKNLLSNYRQPPLVMVRGQGSRIWDADGREFLDYSGGIAVLSVGHCHPKLADAIAKQAATLMHTSNLFYTDKALLLADQITTRTGFSRVYFANSGTEANEALIKLGRRWHYEHGRKERVEIVSTHQSFHGRTMGAVTLTGQPKYHAGMGPMMGGVVHVKYDDLEAMRGAITDKTAAVILEPIQAEGGILVPSDGYLEGVRKLCDERGALLFFDEVQTGYGRTGKFLGREWSGVVPDACSLAKGIGGGFPLGAIALTEALADGLPVGTHGSTFGGNPLACAAGLAVLEIFDEERLVENAHEVGSFLGAQLAEMAADASLPAAVEARGRGLLRGIRVDAGYDALAVLAAMRELGVLASTAGADVVRLAPALNTTKAEASHVLGVLRTALAQATKKS
ncbi:MAG: acetylornithine/succinylornithine family transaminase [Sandaracinaceae bacterium]|nr:acetylornithine/succinylornithine family transaminase [Sandaracinaceae bacterium]